MATVPNIDNYIELLQQCPLFLDIAGEHIDDALRFLNAHIRFFSRRECVSQPGAPLRLAGLVLAGELECAFDNERCDHIIMNHFSRGQLFGLSMTCARVERCPMRLRAVTDCTILFLDYSPLLEGRPLRQAWQARLAANCIAGLARQNVFINLKARILAQRGIRDRVFVYLRSLLPQVDGAVRVPFTRTAMAEFLGVNRSALSRELRRMEGEGLLIISGQDFRLLPK